MGVKEGAREGDEGRGRRDIRHSSAGSRVMLRERKEGYTSQQCRE